VTSGNRKNLSYCAGASAKVLLSQLSDEKLENILKCLRIPRLTENTIIDKAVLTSQIKQIREKGYAVSLGEKMHGAFCISAPVHHYSLPSVLSIIGLDVRLQSKQKSVIRELKKAAGHISDNVSETIKPGSVLYS
jgi:DNA-binding IclR family transcriptional regulator